MRITKVKHLKNYLLEITFSDGAIKKVDLTKFLHSAINPMTKTFRDVNLFKNVKIEHGHLSWNGEMDLSAEDLYNWHN